MELQKTDSNRIYSLVFLLALLGFFQSCACAWAQSGPTQPEAMQFEPVDVTDVVNLATGDFVYTLPLMEVPGPEGGYPIVLSYHSNIGPNQPATWVGLGWTLNPGSINRTLSGYPDDYNGDLVETHYEDYEDLEWGISIGAGWGPVGLNMTYDHYSGMMGANMVVSIAPEGLRGVGVSASVGTNGASAGVSYGKSFGSGLSGGIGVSAGTQGVKATGSLSTAGGQVRGSIGSNGYNVSFSAAGFSMSSRPNGSSFSIGGVGFSSVTQVNGRGKISARGFSTPRIPLLGGFWVSFAYQEREWRLNETYREPSYGYLYQDQYLESGKHNKKYERQLQDDFLYASADIFNANAQGLSGTFTAYQANPYRLFDKKKNDEKANLTNNWDFYNFVTNNVRRFRFLDDPGGNVVAMDFFLPDMLRWGKNYEAIAKGLGYVPRYSGRKITPRFNQETGELEGFTVTDSDGKRYEFKQPVKNLYQHSEIQTTDPDDDYKNYNSMATPYATSWLLTAIKGPDYLDRNSNGGLDNEDWGYWVKFEYKTDERPEIWRSPATGFAPVANSGQAKTFSIGSRNSVYLNSIETASHIAVFNDSSAQNRYSPANISTLNIVGSGTGEPFRFGGIIWPKEAHTYTFHGKYKWLKGLEDLGPEEVVMSLKVWEFSLVEYNGVISPTWREKKDLLDLKRKDVRINYEEDKIHIIDKNKSLDLGDRAFAYLFINKFINNGYTVSKKLDDITLYNKKSLNTPLRYNKFNYDYSLRPNTPGSKATSSDGAKKGSLTLKSVQSMGQNEAPVMPPYRFEYAHGHTPGTGLNPAWNKNDWDRWGSYRDPGEDRGFNKHKTPQNKKMADKSAAWSLTKITNPTGSTVEVEYESDDYYHVNDSYNLDRVKTVSIQNPGRETDTFGLYLEGNFENLNLNEGSTVQIFAWIKRTTCRGYYYDDCRSDVYKNYHEQIFRVNDLNKEIRQITLDRPFDFQRGERSNSYTEEIRYTLIIHQSVFGGRSRVKRISTTDGLSKSITEYKYRAGQYSSGVTASLPAPYTEKKHSFGDEIPDSYLQAFMDHKYSYGRPAPGVIYSNVEVANVSENGEYLNGKTVYEFYTSKDFPYTVSDNGSSLIIEDRSGIYGKPKAVTFYEEISDEGSSSQFRTVKRNEFRYAYSDELHEQGSIYIKGEKIDAKKKMPGITQQKYAFSNQISDNQTVERKVEHTYMNVYDAGSKVINYYYDSNHSLNPRDSVVTQSFPFGWDAYTGSAIHSGQSASDPDEVIVNEYIPAYWKYRGMELKNMLTQNFQQKIYRTDRLDPDDRSSRTDFAPEDDELVSSSVTTWSDRWYNGRIYNSNIWRKNDTYVYDRAFPYREFPEAKLDKLSHAYTRPDRGIPWKQTSNITKYDKYGHVLESVSQDGNYSTTLYDPAGRLVKGIVTNTANDEVLFYNYEYTSSSTSEKAFTGKKSLRVSGTTTLTNAPNNDPVSSEYYKARVWVLASGGDARIGSYTVSPQQGWRFIELKNLRPGQAITISGSAYVDDLVIMPEAAALSSYTYDPLTERLTSVTDANNSTIFFEYDDAGRLTAKRDQDKNLVQRFSYSYGNSYRIKISEEQPDKNQPLTFTAVPREPTSGEQQFIWDFGTGEQIVTPTREVSYTFSKNGLKNVSVLITNREGNDVRVSKQFYVGKKFLVHINALSEPGAPIAEVQARVFRGIEPYEYRWIVKETDSDENYSVQGASNTISFSIRAGNMKEVTCELWNGGQRLAISNTIVLWGPDTDVGEM